MYHNDINNNNVQNFESESPIEIIYTNWDSLKKYNTNTATCLYFLRNISTAIIEPQYQWKDKFQAITELRSLHKSIPSLFFSVFSITSDTIKVLLSDSPTFLTKNILLFLRELFSDFQDETSTEANQLIAWLREFIPIILIKMTSSFNLIKAEASNCLYAITENMLYFDVLVIFLEEAGNRNKEVAKVAFQAFEVAYANIDWVYLKESSALAWAQMLDIVIEIYQMKGVVNEQMTFEFLRLISPIWSEIEGYATDEQKGIIKRIHTERENIMYSKKKKKPNSKHAIQMSKLNYAMNGNYTVKNDNYDYIQNSHR